MAVVNERLPATSRRTLRVRRARTRNNSGAP